MCSLEFIVIAHIEEINIGMGWSNRQPNRYDALCTLRNKYQMYKQWYSQYLKSLKQKISSSSLNLSGHEMSSSAPNGENLDISLNEAWPFSPAWSAPGQINRMENNFSEGDLQWTCEGTIFIILWVECCANDCNLVFTQNQLQSQHENSSKLLSLTQSVHVHVCWWQTTTHFIFFGF